jgi:prephenate dehydratase
MNSSPTPPGRVYYLGPEGSFSAILVNKLFPADAELVPCSSFSEIAARLRADTAAVGLLGIENSNSSDVHETIDIMFEDKFKILGEASLKITMNLIGLSGTRLEQVREVYSHPQALLQCAGFIQEHGLTAHTTASTSAGKQLVLDRDDPGIATIGSRALAQDGSVQVLAADIANVAQNMTRFICVSPTRQVISNLNDRHDKLTYILQLKHRPGSLAHLLSELAGLNVNLTKIQSRPIPGTDWEYVFWIDMEIPQTTERAVSLILDDCATSYTLLGAYEKGKVFES